MTLVSEQSVTITRTERGLAIVGTRITVYDILDYLHADYPLHFIRDSLGLTDAQMTGALNYIHEHQDSVNAEYEEILKESEEIRHYWEHHNRDRFAEIANQEPIGYEAVRAKLQARKAERMAHSA
jgi:uncharacterized protein (DUF433 family)